MYWAAWSIRKFSSILSVQRKLHLHHPQHMLIRLRQTISLQLEMFIREAHVLKHLVLEIH